MLNNCSTFFFVREQLLGLNFWLFSDFLAYFCEKYCPHRVAVITMILPNLKIRQSDLRFNYFHPGINMTKYGQGIFWHFVLCWIVHCSTIFPKIVHCSTIYFCLVRGTPTPYCRVGTFSRWKSIKFTVFSILLMSPGNVRKFPKSGKLYMHDVACREGALNEIYIWNHNSTFWHHFLGLKKSGNILMRCILQLSQNKLWFFTFRWP